MLTAQQRDAIKRAQLNIQVAADKLRYTVDWDAPAHDKARTLSEALVAMHMAEAFITTVRQEILANILTSIDEDK